MQKNDRVKLVAAIVILVVAAGLLAWNFGLFEGSSKPTQPSPNAAPQPPPTPPPGAPAGGQPSAG